MTIDIEFGENGNILVARLFGIFTPMGDELSDQTIAQKCRESAKTKVLIDYRAVEGVPQPLESFRSGDALGQRGFTTSMKLAFVDLPELQSANAFYELVATQKGFQLRHFYDEDEALQWLNE